MNEEMDLELEELIEDDIVEDIVKTEEPLIEKDETAISTFNLLREKGIIPVGEDIMVNTWDDVNEYVDEIPRLVMEGLIQAAPSDAQKIIEYTFAKGETLTKADLKEFINLYLEETEEVELSSVEDARHYLKEQYEKQGMRKGVITATLDALEEEGDEVLIEEAKKTKGTTQLDSKINDAKKEKESQEAAQLQYYNTFGEVVKGLNLSDNRKALIVSELTSGKTNEKINQIVSDPSLITQLVNFLTYFDSTKKEFDFKDFVNQTFSQEITKVKNNITRDHFSTTTRTKSSANTGNKLKLEDLEPII